jgi:MYXO-CTERM domain-containing protein
MGAALFAMPASAVTTLTVDLSTTIRPVTHVGVGSLYGVTETKPADVNGLIAPLHPNMFTNPAAVGSGRQQPVGDAIVVAGRIASLGATVTIRLADWFPGWYSFTNMTDWLSKIDQTVARVKTAGLTNIYAYEIWNEPNGTWAGDDPNATGSKPLSFNQMWLQTYQHLRQVAPGVKITGPSTAGYDQTLISGFLSFCKTNNCLPDIVGWHEGTGISNNVNSYRTLEKQLGVGPLPITINEYSGYGDINDEGRPGASAPLIAQLERSGVETACITFWDVAHPGRLGSLLATDTDRNGGWWFYKWYGEMTGNMVSTTSSLSVNGTNLDGVASLDSNVKNASIILAGINDGTLQIIVKGFNASAASFFGAAVQAVVERTPWASMSTIVNATTTVSTSNLTVSNNQISVTITGANANDGYHLQLTPVDSGGTSGTGGASATGGTKSTGGTSSTTGGTSATGGSRPTGGISSTGGTRATGGASAAGGLAATGGTQAFGGATTISNTGGSTANAATGGRASTGGAINTAGGVVSATGGSATIGGATTTGGQPGAGGASVAGGALAAGGLVGTAGTTTNFIVDAGTTNSGDTSNSGSCSCRVAGGPSRLKQLAALGVFGLLMLLRRRERA